MHLSIIERIVLQAWHSSQRICDSNVNTCWICLLINIYDGLKLFEYCYNTYCVQNRWCLYTLDTTSRFVYMPRHVIWSTITQIHVIKKSFDWITKLLIVVKMFNDLKEFTRFVIFFFIKLHNWSSLVWTRIYSWFKEICFLTYILCYKKNIYK